MSNLDVTSTAADAFVAGADGGSKPQYVDPTQVQKLLKIFDAVCAFVTFTGLFFYSLRFLSDDAAIIAGAVIAAEATYVCNLGLRWIRIYDVDLLSRPLRSAAAALSLITLVGIGILWLIDVTLFNVYGTGMAVWILVNAAHVLTSRTVVGLWAIPLARAGAFRRRIAIMGGGDQAGAAIGALESSDDIDVQILGMFDDRTDDRSPPVVKGYRKLGGLDKLAELARKGEIDMIILSIPMTAHVRLMHLLPKMWALPVEVRVCGQAVDMKLSPSAYKYLGKLPLLTVFSRPLRSAPGALKRITDILVAAGFLTLFAPLGLMIAILLAATSRDSIFVSKRYRNFDDSDLDLLQFRTRSASDNSRLTATGEFLEAMHLHHWPSLLNVLKGQISIVGPAPNTEISEGEVGHYERVANAYCQRHKIKPGLTGWAQIHGLTKTSDTPESVENRVKYELEYVDRVGWLFELSIMLKTPFAWIRNERPEYTA